MNSRILVVEDEIFVAIEIEHVISELGFESAGIAADRASALALASETDIALVDLNLRDGPTGADIGRALAAEGITVLYITANPSQLGDGVPGTLGVIAKPLGDDELKKAIRFADAARRNEADEPPTRLQLFMIPTAGNGRMSHR